MSKSPDTNEAGETLPLRANNSIVAMPVDAAEVRNNGAISEVSLQIGWLVAVLVLASRRPEGDLVVPGSVAGYVWLLGGTLLAGVCVALPYSGARAEGR